MDIRIFLTVGWKACLHRLGFGLRCHLKKNLTAEIGAKGLSNQLQRPHLFDCCSFVCLYLTTVPLFIFVWLLFLYLSLTTIPLFVFVSLLFLCLSLFDCCSFIYLFLTTVPLFIFVWLLFLYSSLFVPGWQQRQLWVLPSIDTGLMKSVHLLPCNLRTSLKESLSHPFPPLLFPLLLCCHCLSVFLHLPRPIPLP